MENPLHQHKMSMFFLLACLFFSSHFILLSCGQLLPIVIEGEGDVVRPRIYIVHVRKPEYMVFAVREELEAWHGSFLPSTNLDSGEPRMVYSYDKAISGFAAWLTPEEVTAMEEINGFLYAHPDEPLAFETTYTHEYLLLSTPGGIWFPPKAANFSMGRIVGVVDSGINPTHDSFVDTYLPKAPSTWSNRCDFKAPRRCNNKIIGARNFISTNGRDQPYDDNGHGTHVASIVAANFVVDANIDGYAKGNACGSAPGAHLAIYRADHTSGLIAAIDQAILDGVDVLSMSVSSPNNEFYMNDLAIGTFAAIEHGIFVSCPAGNYGPREGTVRNDAPWILTVGASTMDRALRVTLSLENGNKVVGESLEPIKNIPTTPFPIVYPGENGNILIKTCRNALGGVDVVGKIVMCLSDPTVSPIQQGELVQNSGGVAMILMNNKINGSTISLMPNVLPTLSTSYNDSMEIIAYISSSGNPTATMIPRGTIYGVNPHPVVASFSSRGPSVGNNGILKPDILGPGVNILGASHTSRSKFVMMSGTSIATPQLSGVAAALQNRYPKWSPAAIRSAIMTSSDILDSTMKPMTDETGKTASVFAAGAGIVNPMKAADPGLVYDFQPEDYIRYLCGLGYTNPQVDAVARRAVDCATVGELRGEELNYPSFSVTLDSSAMQVVALERTVTNVGPPKSIYKLVVDFPPEVSVTVSPEVLGFIRVDEKKSFTVSFAAGVPYPNRRRKTPFQGQLAWISEKRAVRSPISVTFI